MSIPSFPSAAERHEESRRLFLARDLTRYMSLFAPDLIYRQRNGEVIDRNQLSKHVATQFDRLGAVNWSSDVEAEERGEDRVVETVKQTASFATSAFGLLHRTWRFERRGRYTWKVHEGRWRIAEVQVLEERVVGTGWKLGRAPAFVVAVAVAALLITGCSRSSQTSSEPDSLTLAARAESLAVQNVILSFGERMKLVPLLAPDSTPVHQIRSRYAGLTSPSLIEMWARDPRHAPGRLTSSPWPDHIEIHALTREAPDRFLADAEIVERTSADSAGKALKTPVRLAVSKIAGEWLITRYDTAEPGAPRREEPSASALEESDPALAPARAVAVIRGYYDAIDGKRYVQAYQMWESNGAASGRTQAQFVSGYAHTRSVQVAIARPGPIGAAAGSRYIEIPVHVTAINDRGERESYVGKYTLRRAVVDGATLEQRLWHIYSASLRQEKPAP